MNFVPYKGGAPMAQDLMAGHIPLAFDPIGNLAPAHKAKKIKILAITSMERSALLPEVPTFAELNYPSATGETWIGASTKKGTSAATIKHFARSFQDAGKVASVREKLAEIGLIASAQSPDEMDAIMFADTQRYSKLVNDLGLKID